MLIPMLATRPEMNRTAAASNEPNVVAARMFSELTVRHMEPRRGVRRPMPGPSKAEFSNRPARDHQESSSLKRNANEHGKVWGPKPTAPGGRTDNTAQCIRTRKVDVHVGGMEHSGFTLHLLEKKARHLQVSAEHVELQGELWLGHNREAPPSGTQHPACLARAR